MESALNQFKNNWTSCDDRYNAFVHAIQSGYRFFCHMFQLQRIKPKTSLNHLSLGQFLHVLFQYLRIYSKYMYWNHQIVTNICESLWFEANNALYNVGYNISVTFRFLADIQTHSFFLSIIISHTLLIKMICEQSARQLHGKIV